MPVALTATLQDVFPPRVLLTVTGLTVTGTPDAVELFRVVAGERTPVRAGSTDAVTDTAFVRVDAELPFGVPVRYEADVNGDNYVFNFTRNTFDATSESWAGEGATSVARVTSPTHDGAGSLRATKTMTAGTDSIRFNDNAGLRDLSAAGPTLSAWFYLDTGSRAVTGTGLAAQLELQSPGFAWNAGPSFVITPGVWTQLTYSPDPVLLASCRSIGVQFSATGVNGSQAVYLDTVQQGISPIRTDAVTYELPGGNAVVSDAIGGTAAEVVILAWPEKSYDRQRTVFQVGGRNVVVSGDLAMFTGTIEMYVETTSSRDNLLEVLSTLTGNVAQLRQAGGYDGVDCYFAVLSINERRWSQDGTDQKRVLAVDVAETESWAPALEARGFTYGDLTAAYEGLTYLNLSNDFATYLDLTQADLS